MKSSSIVKNKMPQIQIITKQQTNTVFVKKNIDEIKSEDKTNLTNVSRDLSNYASCLGLTTQTLKQEIIAASKLLGKKIKLLDAGCGEAKAIEELLSDVELKEYIDSCTGVSLHYFQHVKTVLEKHSERFNYYLGEVQSLLNEQKNNFDFIFDVCGAYLYTDNKLGLLKYYHQSLVVGGVARVWGYDEKSMIFKEGKKKKILLDQICKTYPNTFTQTGPSTSYHDKFLVINIKKTTADWPLPTFLFESFVERPVFAAFFTSKKQLKAGNAICTNASTYTLLNQNDLDYFTKPPNKISG